jgi:hypothetical protein
MVLSITNAQALYQGSLTLMIECNVPSVTEHHLEFHYNRKSRVNGRAVPPLARGGRSLTWVCGPWRKLALVVPYALSES